MDAEDELLFSTFQTKLRFFMNSFKRFMQYLLLQWIMTVLEVMDI